MPEVTEITLRIFVKETLPKYDGMNELLKDSLNHLYCGINLRSVDRRRHFNTLLNKYEAFLKKLYYVINGYEMRAVVKDHQSAMFLDALLSFDCLAGLRSNPDDRYKKFNNYLERVTAWRNKESHDAISSTENEVKTATHILVTMYLFVISQNTLELAGTGAID